MPVVECIESVCSSCQRPLRIPADYVGKRISCKFCSHTFVVQAEEESQTSASAASQSVLEENAVLKEQVARLQEALSNTGGELALRIAAHATAVEQLLMQVEEEKQAVDVQWRQKHLAHVQEAEERLRAEQARGAAERDKVRQLEKDCEGLRDEKERHRLELAALHAKAMEKLQKQLEAEKQAVDAQWRQKHLAHVQEGEERLRAEQARGAAERDKVRQLEKDCQGLRDEKERQRLELAALHAKAMEQLQKQLKEEKQALDVQWQQKHLAHVQEAEERWRAEQARGAAERDKVRQLEKDCQGLRDEKERHRLEHARAMEKLQKQLEADKQAVDVQWQQKHLAHVVEAEKRLRAEQLAECVKVQQLESDCQRLRHEIVRYEQELVSLRQEQEQAAKQVKALTEERDRLNGQCSEAARVRKLLDERLQAESRRLTQDLQQVRQQEGAASQRVKELESAVDVLRKEIAGQRDGERESPYKLAALQQEIENARSAERQNWQKQMEAMRGQFDQERRKLCKAYEKLRQDFHDMQTGKGCPARAPQ